MCGCGFRSLTSTFVVVVVEPRHVRQQHSAQAPLLLNLVQIDRHAKRVDQPEHPRIQLPIGASILIHPEHPQLPYVSLNPLFAQVALNHLVPKHVAQGDAIVQQQNEETADTRVGGVAECKVLERNERSE